MLSCLFVARNQGSRRREEEKRNERGRVKKELVFYWGSLRFIQAGEWERGDETNALDLESCRYSLAEVTGANRKGPGKGTETQSPQLPRAFKLLSLMCGAGSVFHRRPPP